MTHPLECLQLERWLIARASEGVEQLEISYTAGGNAE